MIGRSSDGFTLWGVEIKRLFTGTLTYVEITSSGVNCVLNNLRGGKS